MFLDRKRTAILGVCLLRARFSPQVKLPVQKIGRGKLNFFSPNIMRNEIERRSVTEQRVSHKQYTYQKDRRMKRLTLSLILFKIYFLSCSKFLSDLKIVAIASVLKEKRIATIL